METQEASTNQQRFAIERKRHRYLGSMIEELSAAAADLDQAVAAAQQHALANPRDYTYASYAAAIVRRRDNLLRTVANLKRRNSSNSDT